MPREVEIVVVGAGITGVATTRVLAQAGRDVVCLEQFAIGHTRGSSHGESRIFRLSYPDRRWVRLAQAALDGWLELEEESGASLLLRTGSLDMGEFVRENRRALAACGATVEPLEADEIRARWPIAVDPGVPALFQPDGGVLLADRAWRALADGARSGGATILEGTRVTGLSVERGSVRVLTDRDELRARAAVVTAGAWAQPLLAPVGIELAVVPTRETVVYLALPGAEALPALIDEVAPAPGTFRLSRSGQITYGVPSPGIGLKTGLHHSGPVANPDDDGLTDDGIVAWVSQWAERRFPDAATRVARVETCLYTNTADESFVLERHGRIVVGSCCSGHGFKFAPTVGRTLAALAREAAG